MLYLLPTPLSDGEEAASFLKLFSDLIPKIELFLVENKKSARAVLKNCNINIPLSEIPIYQLDEKFDVDLTLTSFKQIAIMSEAGCPCVADPGNEVVLRAHALGIKVVPLIGPSSIMLALMASGLNGQQFHFHGYLPIKEPERTAKMKSLESGAPYPPATQIFIETPYRAESTAKYLISTLPDKTLLSVASDLTGEQEVIRTFRISDWREKGHSFQKTPTIFLIQNNKAAN